MTSSLKTKATPRMQRCSAVGRTSSLLFIFALGSFALSHLAQAVSPPPDGGYAGGNTAEGTNALFSRTTGGYNTAVGWLSLRSDTNGSFNTATGAGSLLANTGDQNTATGAGALLSNTTGAFNTGNGAFALFSNASGGSNTAVGNMALFNNTTGEQNTAVGESAMIANTIGASNTALGVSALRNNTTGNYNIAIGHDALSVSDASGNTAIGFRAAYGNTDGTSNTAVGYGALLANSTGHDNTAVGSNAGSNLTTGHNNICIGSGVSGVDYDFNTIRIGDNLPIDPGLSACYIGGIVGQSAYASGVPVYIGSDGKLGIYFSARRFKRDIESMEKSSEAVLSLKPVRFRYENDPSNMRCFGLIAEDVAEVNPELVIRDGEGKPLTVRYEAVNAMLLNEFLKEHRKNQQQEATLANLQKELADLSATVKTQAAQIEKVSAQVEASKSVTRVVLNNP